jgi:hypothetical protein
VESGALFQRERPTAESGAHPLISAESNEHRLLIRQQRIAFRLDHREKPPANGRELCAGRENSRLLRLAEEPIHAATSSNGSHPDKTDHAEQNRAGLPPEPGALA